MANSTQTYIPDIAQIIDGVEGVVFGMENIQKLILISIICNDHILLEDVPGTGKTMVAKAISKIFDLKFHRIQGTPDLLPTDLMGVNIYDFQSNKFNFVPGPIFSNILIFDEINRTSPKTQSALLEAMAEHQVTIENETYKLEDPFFVIATQNPIEHLGTYPLPQAQIDRFLIKTKVGYPSKDNEKKILLTEDGVNSDSNLPKLGKEIILKWQNEYKKVFIKDELVEKLLWVIDQTRTNGQFELGISPRSGRKLTKALMASAYIHGRDFVNKDDIYELFLPIMAHRVYAKETGQESALLSELIKSAKF